MIKFLLNKCLPLCVLVASLLCACEEDYDETYGSGSPLPENVIPLPGHIYTYNAQGLVTKIIKIVNKTGGDGVVRTEYVTVANILYPQSDRAVLEYVADISIGVKIVYTFAFGENHFANRIIETDSEGSYLTKLTYDKDGHLTSLKADEDRLKMEWTNGNVTKIKQNEDNAYAVLTYGTRTDYARYGMSPFLLDVNFGPIMRGMYWWFECGMDYALYLGFLGRPSQNLPETIVCYDDLNQEPYEGAFMYGYDDYAGTWYWRQIGN